MRNPEIDAKLSALSSSSAISSSMLFNNQDEGNGVYSNGPTSQEEVGEMVRQGMRWMEDGISKAKNSWDNMK